MDKFWTSIVKLFKSDTYVSTKRLVSIGIYTTPPNPKYIAIIPRVGYRSLSHFCDTIL